MITPKISIIMPVYNAATTVSRMVDSIIAQTLQEWELLAIDDGSTDDSGKLLDAYAARDSRIRVFHKKNAGVAMARQLGVDNAMGEYSIHADSDDWVDSTMLEDMYNKAVTEDADVVIADYYIHKDGVDSIRRQEPTSYNSIDILYQISTGRIFGGLWHKLLKHAHYKRYNARFFEGINYCEDVLLLAQILCHNQIKVAYLDKGYYHYLTNSQSITNHISPAVFEGLKKYYAKLSQFLPNEERFKAVALTFPLGLFSTGFTNMFYSTHEVKQEFAKVRKLAYQTKSIRWKLGYLCIDLGLYKIARKLVRY